mmetsp:Transcript_16131/g.30474  ORF Transcript_16131/g.30474 Transcript_16131/m.30474 type:complete len:110 (+) Transcript_16131:183-512(+)
MTNDSSSITTTTKNNHDHEVQSHDSVVSPPTSPGGQQRVNIRGQWTHNPVVLAALACSNMSSCEEVKQMYHECQRNQSDSILCEAAEKYYRMCHLRGDEQSILDYNPME